MKALACAILVAAATAHAQSSDTGFVLDTTKPYVYLKFDHVSPRKPLPNEKAPLLLWLRIVNNCKVPISVRSYGLSTAIEGTGVFDEVIPVQQGITVQANSGEVPLTDDRHRDQKAAKPSLAKTPEGYSAELSSLTRILPGSNLLFAVPRDHVSRDWFLRVKVFLNVSKPSAGIGPSTELDF